MKTHQRLTERAETQVGQEPGAGEPSRLSSPISAHFCVSASFSSPLEHTSLASPGLAVGEVVIKSLSFPSSINPGEGTPQHGVSDLIAPLAALWTDVAERGQGEASGQAGSSVFSADQRQGA